MQSKEATDVPALTCYRIRSHIEGRPVAEFGDVVDLTDHNVTVFGPVGGDGFAAQAYVMDSVPRPVAWAGFLEAGFDGLRLGSSMSPSALVVVRARLPGRARRDVMFAYAFGVAGRYLLRGDAYERGYGLRTALNLLYPRSAAETARLRSVDSKRRGATILRSRSQVSDLAEFEAFDVNRLRDVVSKATGVPADVDTWGGRVGGGDSLALNVDVSFEELGDLCRRVDGAHALDDYRDRFDWIDYIQPVTDPSLLKQLEEEVVSRLRARRLDALGLAPPEIVDWDRVAAFRYHFDRRQGRARDRVRHPEMRLQDYVAGLSRTGRLEGLDVGQLRSGSIWAVDGDGSDHTRWTAWKCLVGEFVVDGESYVLDEGDFFRVRTDYLRDLDAEIEGIPTSSVVLPPSTASTREEDYNREAAASSADFVLLDRRLVRITGRTTPIEVCDLLSTSRQLIHVKRHLGSSDLSHLFAQGFVSADLLQMSPMFRSKAHATVVEVAHGRDGFDFLGTAGFVPAEFEVVYAIVASWNGRQWTEGLPFFSKVNLRQVTTSLRSRGFKVGLTQIQA